MNIGYAVSWGALQTFRKRTRGTPRIRITKCSQIGIEPTILSAVGYVPYWAVVGESTA